MNTQPAMAPAMALPIYERATRRYGHLRQVPDAKTFCRQLCRLAAVDSITPTEHVAIAQVAEGGEWPR